MKRSLFTLLAFCCLSLTALADVESGPKAGSDVEEFKVFAVTEPTEGKTVNKEIEIVKDRAKQPTIFIFVNGNKFTRPTAQYLRKIDEKVDSIDEKAGSVVVWVHSDVDKAKDYLPKIQQSLKFGRTALTVYEGDASGPKGWALNTDAAVTTVIVSKGKVAKTFAYDTLNETDVPAVLAAWKKELGK